MRRPLTPSTTVYLGMRDINILGTKDLLEVGKATENSMVHFTSQQFLYPLVIILSRTEPMGKSNAFFG